MSKYSGIWNILEWNSAQCSFNTSVHTIAHLPAFTGISRTNVAGGPLLMAMENSRTVHLHTVQSMTKQLGSVQMRISKFEGTIFADTIWHSSLIVWRNSLPQGIASYFADSIWLFCPASSWESILYLTHFNLPGAYCYTRMLGTPKGNIIWGITRQSYARTRQTIRVTVWRMVPIALSPIPNLMSDSPSTGEKK